MDHSNILDTLGGAKAVAAALTVPVVRVQRWHMRRRIPAEYWADIVALGSKGGVTLAALAEANTGRRRTEQAA